LAVNKMDLVDYDQSVFDQIVADYSEFAKKIGITDFTAIPLSGLAGDNIASRSDKTPYYSGPTLIEHLETVDLGLDARAQQPLRLPVQWVNRPNLDFRGFAGQIASGTVKPGDAVRIIPSGKTSTVERIVSFDGDLEQAVAGQSITLTLADELDCSRGDVICAAGNPAEAADQFEATIVWMAEDEMLAGRNYVMKIGTQTVSAAVHAPKYRVDVNTLDHLAAKTLGLNDIGICEISTDKRITFESYALNKDMGGFILIDRMTNATIAAGTLHFALRRAQNVHWQSLDVSRDAHAAIKNQRPRVLWFTGLSGSGKSTIANLVEKKLHALGKQRSCWMATMSATG
jgi:bifunctional enzyme CysN/CysC